LPLIVIGELPSRIYFAIEEAVVTGTCTLSTLTVADASCAAISVFSSFAVSREAAIRNPLF
jgi:hypothetical protein